MLEKIKYVGYRVTENCNAGRACIDRCFSRENGIQADDPPISTVRQTLFRIAPHVETVNIMGGEPTLRGDLPHVLAFAHEVGLGTVLSSNGILLDDRKLRDITQHLDWLSLSIDADTERLEDGMRGEGQWDAIHSVLDWFVRNKPRCRLKVNTQVTAVNRDHIMGIPDLPGFDEAVTDWKLLQWTPRGDAQKVMRKWLVTERQFAETVEANRNAHPDLTIVTREWPEPEPDTIIVRPDGLTEVNGPQYDYMTVGNVLEEPPGSVFARAGTIYQNFAATNRSEFRESYPGFQ